MSTVRGRGKLQESVADDARCERVTRHTFSTETRYNIRSADGTRLLLATDTKSGSSYRDWQEFAAGILGVFHISLPLRFQGYSMKFGPPKPEQANHTDDDAFTFSGSPGRYRLHCSKHGNNMVFFLGVHSPREWVVWDTVVPTNGEWEVLDVMWCGDDNDGKFKIRGHEGQYVKWAVSGFKSSEAGDATEFILHKEEVAATPRRAIVTTRETSWTEKLFMFLVRGVQSIIWGRQRR